jgi:O-antigen/teichoic acid export membrane protein
MDEARAAPTRLSRDVFITFSGKAISLFCGLLIVILLARELGPSRQGLFAVAFSLTLILIHLGGLGISTANPYFAAREPPQQQRIAMNSLWLAAGLGLVLAAIGFGLKLIVPAVVHGLTWSQLAIAFGGIPAALAALFLQSILLGQGRMVAYIGVEVVQFASTLVALAVGFRVVHIDVTGALIIVTGSRIASLVGYLAALRLTPSLFDATLARRMLAYGFRAYLAVAMSFLVIRLDLLLVNGYLGSTQAGLYSVAATIADGMYVVPLVVGLNLFPRVARSGKTVETAEVFRSFAVIYGLICLATIPLARPAIQLFFGDEFAGSVRLFYWLLPGIYCLGLLTLLAYHFAGRGYPKEAVVVWFVGLGLNVALNVAFLPGHGAWVASLASSIAYVVLLALHIRLFARHAGGYGVLRPRVQEVMSFVRTGLAR